MMNIVANQKYIRVSPRKLKLIADSIRSLSPIEARRQLKFMMPHGEILSRVIAQAMANATHNHRLDVNNLKFKSIEINESPTLKRFRAVSRGQAHSIYKRASHIRIVLTTKENKLPEVKKTSDSVDTKPASKPKTTTK